MLSYPTYFMSPTAREAKNLVVSQEEIVMASRFTSSVHPH